MKLKKNGEQKKSRWDGYVKQIPKCHPKRPQKGGKGLCTRCYAKKIRIEWSNEQRQNNKEKNLEWIKNNYTRWKKGQRRRHYKKKYGITIEQYHEMFKQQKGKCAICQKYRSRTRKLSVDHHHKTGKVRGLLCTRCNFAIGYANEDVKIIDNMKLYLKLK